MDADSSPFYENQCNRGFTSDSTKKGKCNMKIHIPIVPIPNQYNRGFTSDSMKKGKCNMKIHIPKYGWGSHEMTYGARGPLSIIPS